MHLRGHHVLLLAGVHLSALGGHPAGMRRATRVLCAHGGRYDGKKEQRKAMWDSHCPLLEARVLGCDQSTVDAEGVNQAKRRCSGPDRPG